MRVFTIIAMLLLVALAGCADNGDKDTDPTDGNTGTETGTGTQTGTGTGTGGPGTGSEGNNTAPVASITADVMNGTAPLVVNITLEGSDADGDNLTWTLMLNGTEAANGTELPAAANFTLEAGNHTFVFTVSDGELSTDANLTVAVEAGEVIPTGPEPIFQSFDLGEGCDLCVDGAPVFNGADGCIGWNLQRAGMDCAWLPFGPEYQGTPYSVFSFTDGTIPGFGSDGRPDIEFRDGCGTSSAQLSTVWGGGDTKVGIVPDGARCIVAYEFHWPNLGHTIEISIGADVHS